MTPTSTQRKLCRSLGPDYEIKLFDLEYVIYRDFHNGFDSKSAEPLEKVAAMSICGSRNAVRI